MAEKDLYILYGSQTGNGEDIAKSISELCNNLGYVHKLSTLNNVKKTPLKDLARAIVIVCSTTGNGDAPENAEAFWREIKKRAASKELFLDVPYAVLGLGDTNYDKFCHMGKSIDKRLSELGGKRCLPLACADEPTNFEEIVEQFKKDIMVALKPIMCAPDKSTKCSIDKCDTVTEMGTVPSCVDTSLLCSQATQNVHSILPEGSQSILQICSVLGVKEELLSHPPESASLPRDKSRSDYDLGLPDSQSDTLRNDTADTSRAMTEVSVYDAQHPYHANIVSAHWLTRPSVGQYRLREDASHWGHTKRVVHMEVSLGQSGMSYAPGDSIGVCCPNPAHLVALVLDRVNSSSPKLSGGPLTLETRITWQQEHMTVEELLTYRLDLVSTIRKDAVMILANHCTQEIETNHMRWLCCKVAPGPLLWKSFIETQCLGVAELLSLFPSCTPSLQVLTSVLRPLPPRYYSIACSPLQQPGVVSVAFSLVRFSCRVSPPEGAQKECPPVLRSGLCTSYLEDKLAPWLDPKQTHRSQNQVSLRIFMKPTVYFRMPGSVEPPLILIGPGTGVAPFIGFLAHRASVQQSMSRSRSRDDCTEGLWRGGYELQAEDLPCEVAHQGLGKFQCSQIQCKGDVWLFFGCRGEDDYLYKEEMQSRLKDGSLTVLETALSRQTQEKLYVTHRIIARGDELANLILNKGGYIYICGDGNKMAKDVDIALLNVLQEHGKLSQKEAEHCLQEMKIRRRYVLDIW
eukprot:CAMPEP_0182424024 /NCGR_PEP_ID=MMETSP1167-20130531/10146_1 /TAXON_ID=2988 /ORGANISM="Mallomonas Sp, Strain CCMP3275" /LENGTH=742 /DNA_ID=CAMNT_0024603497 /DNA_START=58 /DNA_END=2283 /DNA_ORIENTATION=-